MLNYDALVDTFLTHPNDCVFVHRLHGSIYTIPASKLKMGKPPISKRTEYSEVLQNPWEFACLLPFSPQFRAAITKKFAEKFGFAEEFKNTKGSKAREALIQKKGLWEQFRDLFEQALRNDIGIDLLENGVWEEEASPEQYQEIRALLEQYEAKHYEKEFSDHVVFYINDANMRRGTAFVVLGNAGDTFGISFYLGERPLDGAYSLYAESITRDPICSGTLGTVVSFYCEKQNSYPMSKGRYVNPYGDDHAYTSIVIHEGVSHECYLGKGVARFLKKALERAMKMLDTVLAKQRLMEKKDGAVTYILTPNKDGVSATIDAVERSENDEHNARIPLLYYAYRDGVPAPLIGNEEKAARGNYDLSLRLAPGGVMPFEGEDVRHSQLCYLLILADRQSRKILFCPIVSDRDGTGFCANLCAEFEKAYGADRPLPKKVYVNCAFDADIAELLFNGRCQIVSTPKKTTCDDFYESMCREWELENLAKA